MFDALRACGAVELASSEEQPADHDLGGRGYSVAFDPLDGSSIIGANWAVRGVAAALAGWLAGRATLHAPVSCALQLRCMCC